MSKPLLSGLAAAFLLSACAVGPDYERPSVPSAAAFPEGKGGKAAISAGQFRGGGGEKRRGEQADLDLFFHYGSGAGSVARRRRVCIRVWRNGCGICRSHAGPAREW